MKMEILIIENGEGDAEFIKNLLDKRIGEIKFLITQSARECIVYLFNGLKYYGVYVEQTGKTTDDFFLGAGLLQQSVVKWGSDTFKSKFGRDRPNDPTEADSILAEFQGALGNFVSQIGESLSKE